MQREKKLTKEDTWRPADLQKYIRETDRGDHYYKKREESERIRRSEDPLEKHYKDPDEQRQERHRSRDWEGSKERRSEDKRDRHGERRKEGSQYRYAERDKRHDGEEKHVRQRDTERHSDRERVRDRERYEEEKERRRHESDKERRREERDREHRSDRRRYGESGDRRESDDQQTEQKDRQHRREQEDRARSRDLQERHRDRRHLEHGEDRGYKDEHRRHKEDREHDAEHRRHKEERERRHREKALQEQHQRERESKGHRDRKESNEKIRYSLEGERDRHSERRRSDEERKRQKERRQRDEEDFKTSHKDKTTSKKPSPDRRDRDEKKVAVSELFPRQCFTEVKDDGDAHGPVANKGFSEPHYEDDFEDYEEDFDELAEGEEERVAIKEPELTTLSSNSKALTPKQRKEIEAIKKAMAEENEKVGTAQFIPSERKEHKEEQTKPSTGYGEDALNASQGGRFIDFVAAKQREMSKKSAKKQSKRSADLLRLIDLDFSVTFSLLDLPPVKEYELYIRHFGNENTKQAYIQCNEDNVERDIQTEEIEMCEKWTQYPTESDGACGDPNLALNAQNKAVIDSSFDSKRFASFLQRASQVMLVLLEEAQVEKKSQVNFKSQANSPSFSDGSLQINTKLPFLHGREISMVHFSQVQRHTMLSVHMPVVKPSAWSMDRKTVICVWNIWEPSQPQKILVYQAEVQCCCFSPGKAVLVFAGTSVGSVLLWDLREHASNHSTLKLGEKEWTLRQPTFSTDGVMAGSGHFSSITSVEVVHSAVAGGGSFLSPDDDSSGLSFQLASLDESGLLKFWVVVELPKDNKAGSSTDLGLWPGGRVKLLHSSAILTTERSSLQGAEKVGSIQTWLLKFLPTDSNHFFIGTNLGVVDHGTSYGLKAPPKYYRFREVEVRPVDVCSIHFSPFKPHYFLVGCADGSIRLHSVSQEYPVAEWSSSTGGEPVVSVQWAQTRPAVFCVLDSASNIYVWDLMKSDSQPVVTEKMSNDRVTSMAMFGDSSQQNKYSGIALAHKSGEIELLYFTKHLTLSSLSEEEKLDCLMAEAF